jgi:hypothetical protein
MSFLTLRFVKIVPTLIKGLLLRHTYDPLPTLVGLGFHPWGVSIVTPSLGLLNTLILAEVDKPTHIVGDPTPRRGKACRSFIVMINDILIHLPT